MTDRARPYDLRVEHLWAPLGLGPEPPRVSWKLPLDAAEQHAYRVVAGEWDSGRVESPQSLFVPVGVAPSSGLAVEWRVKTWTGLGESEWSEPSTWEHGLLEASDWQARWVAPLEADDVVPWQRPAYELTGRFVVDGAVARARLYATAHGVYEAFLNGARVGDVELAPGWTAYRKRLLVQAYDVTGLVRPGENVVSGLLSDGWWRGQNSVSRRVDDYGPTTALLMQLAVEAADGTRLVVGTDGTWRSRPSHVLRADLVSGEVHDLRVSSPWSAVRVEDFGYAALCASPSPPVRRVEELRPTSVRRLGERRWVVDVGQNVNGWMRLHDVGPVGAETVLTYGEWLDRDGDVVQDHVGYPVPTDLKDVVSFQVDQVVSDGAGRTFEPRHSTKGFQFVRVEGPASLTADDLTAVVVHTDLERRGRFACSDERVNAIHRIAEWSLRGNACDIPTDCPTRERAGWTGDWQVYVETAAFLYDVGGFSVKWLRDLAAEQRPDGRVTNLVPESHPGDGRRPEYWPLLEGSAGWGDAAVQVPWAVYRATGDVRVLEEQWPSMTAWVDYAARAAAGGRRPFIWDTGWHFGEWLEPGQTIDDAIAAASAADHGPVATAYLFRSASQVAEAGVVLGRSEDAARYAALAAEVREAWRSEFLSEDGRVVPDTQAGCVRALAFGLVSDARVATRLVELVRAAGTHVGTGFLSTGLLLPVLADTGHVDVAYELLLQDSEPSWLTMVDRGATTVWEEWGGVDAHGVAHASLNHYSKGAVIGFLHQYTAGLRLVEPGYRRFRVAPVPGGGITWAEASHDSPYGRIEVRWEQAGDGSLEVDVVIPPGTEAEVVVPGGEAAVLRSGRHTVRG